MSSKEAGKAKTNAEAGIFLDLFSLGALRRAALYALIMTVSLMIQTMVCSHIGILGVRPMFLPVFAVAAGVFGGGAWGGFFGLACGLLCGMSFHETTVMFAVLFPVIGFFSGMVTDFFFNRRFFSYFFLCAAALALTAGVSALWLWITHDADPEQLARTAGLQALWSLPFAIPMYFPCRRISEKKLY